MKIDLGLHWKVRVLEGEELERVRARRGEFKRKIPIVIPPEALVALPQVADNWIHALGLGK